LSLSRKSGALLVVPHSIEKREDFKFNVIISSAGYCPVNGPPHTKKKDEENSQVSWPCESIGAPPLSIRDIIERGENLENLLGFYFRCV
jgi:hypothetical protein